jgi:hypothetical protein
MVPVLLAAQEPWGLTLFVDPFPSPYQSDWETNSRISSLTIVNPTGQERDVSLVYQVTNTQGRVLASGRGDPLAIPPGAPTVLTSYLDIAGSSTRDREIEDQMERTGRVPEGTYQACVTMAQGSGFVLGESCAVFTIVYPDSPVLLAPVEGEAVAGLAPLFQWTPIQVPPTFQVQYILQVAELLPNQTPAEALTATILQFEAPELSVTNLQYPIDAQSLEPGKRYVWRVVATDQNGFPPSTNGGASEIRSFRIAAGTGVASTQRSELTLGLSNAFDDEPVEAHGAGDEAGATPVDISQLCSMWESPPEAISLSSDSPIGLRRFAGQPAVLFRDSAATRWWISTRTAGGRRSVLVGGDCSGEKTRTRWIASKDSTLQSKINGMLTAKPAGVATPVGNVDSLAFGMVVLALGKETVEAPAGFAEAEAFLGGRTLEVAPGLNLYTVLSLNDWGLWWLFQAMGFGEKEIELTGFLGWDASWSLGGAVGNDAGVDVSTERKFLVIRGDLPKRKPVGPLSGLFESSRLSIEFALGDSTGRGFGLAGKQPGYSLDLTGKLIHTVQINSELSLQGSIGFDLAREAKTGFGKEMLGRWDWLRGVRTTASANLADGRVRRAIAPPSLEEPEVGLDLTLSYGFEGRISSIWRADPVFANVQVEGASLDAKIRFEDKKLTAALSGSLTIGSVEGVVKAGISREFTWGPAPDTVGLKDQEAAAELKLSERVSAVEGTMPDCVGQTGRATEVCKAYWEWQGIRKKLQDARNPNPSWRARISAGQMSLGQLLDLLRGWRR